MARKPLSMRTVREILRLKENEKLSIREIARSCGVPAATVSDYLQRARVAGIHCQEAQELGDEELRQRLLAVHRAESAAADSPPLPDWAEIHRELGRQKGVTLKLLWEEYIRENPNGYKYTQFCYYYRQWAKTIEPTMRQTYPPGEKMQVDWVGETVWIEGRGRQEGFEAHIFVAVLGASNKIYAEAFSHCRTEAWIAAHCHAYEFFGGVPRLTIPDNAKTAVARSCYYDPQLQRNYKEMARHYGTVILPARPRHARDKAKGESAVQIAERSLLAPLRHRQFFHVVELNEALRERLATLNKQPFQKLEGSRDSWFENEEKHYLLPLPQERYCLAHWVKAKVNIDYHVVVDKHFYSVPFQLVHKRVEAKVTEKIVEIFHNGNRVAVHARSYQKGRHSTLDAHRPKSQQGHSQWSPGRLIRWARKDVGPLCGLAVKTILERKPHPEQGYRACLGIMRLAQSAGASRMEAACRRALRYDVCTYPSIKSILANKLDQEPIDETKESKNINHPNIRGSEYYK